MTAVPHSGAVPHWKDTLVGTCWTHRTRGDIRLVRSVDVTPLGRWRIHYRGIRPEPEARPYAMTVFGAMWRSWAKDARPSTEDERKRVEP